MYHASLSDETKKHVFSMFASSRSSLRCLVSTIAFGMVSLAFFVFGGKMLLLKECRELTFQTYNW